MENYKLLPDEQSELYKRFYVKLPLEQFGEELLGGREDPKEAGSLLAMSKQMRDNLGIKFDLLFGSSTHVIENENGFVKVIDVGMLTEEDLARKMYRNKENRLVAFIHAHTKKLVLIDVPDGKTADISILFANSDRPFATQIIIRTGRESKLSLFEWFGSKTTRKSLNSALHEATIGRHSTAEINIVHNEDERTYVVGFSKARILERGYLKLNYVYNGGIGSRTKNEINAEEYQAKDEVIELVLGSSEQQFDINTIITNGERETVADLESKAALMDESMCLLKGFASLLDNAKGARSFVNERGILLDKDCHMDSLPGMSINNSDVKATHSSATAPVDEDALFYLMSRGADETAARRLVVAGFFASTISRIENEKMKEAVSALMHDKINNGCFGVIPKLDMHNIWYTPAQSPGMFQGHYKYRNE